MPFQTPANEEQRLEELRRYALLDTPPEKAFDDITKLAARIFRAPISMVTLIDEDREWFKSCFGLETREVARGAAFCAYAIMSDEVLIVPDAREDPRFSGSPLVTGDPHIRFYAGAPLKTSNGLNLGTLCIIDTKPRRPSRGSMATLAALAQMVVDEIELRYQIGERRREVETLRLLQAAVQQTSESVIITTAEVDLPGPEIVFVNPAFTKLTGYSAEEAIGKTPRILHGPKTERAVLDGIRSHLARGEEFEFQVTNYRKDGSAFVLAGCISPIRNESGKVTHFIDFQHDATEHNRAEADLIEAREEAERSSRAKSEFVSRMSHELRTPLHAILGFAQLLELDPHSPDDAESVTQIVRAGNHLLGLINEVLDIARIESGKLALAPEPVNVRATLESALSLMKPLAAERRIRLAPLGGDLDGAVLCNAQRFKQVLLNLLSNAVKFSREGGYVAISCEKAGDRLRFNIEDHGRGISAENMPRLFVPFERLDPGDAAAEGAGLGLTLSKRLTEAMGGRIGVESVPDQRTVFWVELPLVTGAGAVAEPGTGDAIHGGEAPRSATPRTLLYIEDNQSNLRLVECILARRPEVTLISAMHGTLGLELARQHRPDLLLLDLHLPDMQGDEILRKLRADPLTEKIPVVMISADATAGQIERLRAAGADEYLTKPIDVRRFLAVVDGAEPRRAGAIPEAGAHSLS